MHNFQKKRWWTSCRDSLKTYERARGKAGTYIHILLTVVQYGSMCRENIFSSMAECLSTVLRKLSKVQNARLTQEIQLTSKRKGPWLRWHPCKKSQELLADLEACGTTHLLRAEIYREVGDCIGALIFATPWCAQESCLEPLKLMHFHRVSLHTKSMFYESLIMLPLWLCKNVHNTLS